jgi:hypothetical protein
MLNRLRGFALDICVLCANKTSLFYYAADGALVCKYSIYRALYYRSSERDFGRWREKDGLGSVEDEQCSHTVSLNSQGQGSLCIRSPVIGGMHLA